MQKPIIIYNYFTANLNNKIINNSNKIKLSQNSELTLIEYNIVEKSKFVKNTFEKTPYFYGVFSFCMSYKYSSNSGAVVQLTRYSFEKNSEEIFH